MAGQGVVLGYLKYVLGFDSLAFEKGADEAEKRLKSTQRSLQKTADRMQGIGAKLSVGLTAPIAALGTAFLGSARGMAEAIPQLEQAARLANTSTTEFQKLAYAAKSVGVESDKLSDVYKDVNDKVGEFISTGGGEMKDFFENVAPKVGLTAEAFRKLSGPQALQAYVNGLQRAGLSQAQMTFYMESLADDATLLLPLLLNNGKAMEELGGKAAIMSPADIEQFKRYNDAQRQMETSLQRLTIAFVSSGLLDGVTRLVTGLAEFTANISRASPETMKWAIGIGAVAASIGPAVIGVSSLLSILSPLLARMALVSGATGLAAMGSALGAVAAAALVVVAAYKNWDKIGPWIDQVATRMTAWSTKADADLKKFNDGIAAMDRQLGVPSKDQFFASIEANFRASVARIDAWLAGVQKWADQFDMAMSGFATSATANMQRLYTGVKTWVSDRLNAVWDGVASKVEWVKDKFFGLYDAVVGHSYVPDMVDEIGQHMRRLDQEMVAPATAATGKTGQAFRELGAQVGPILDRLYPDQARQNTLARDIETLTAAAKAGIIPMQAAADAIKRLNDEYARELGGAPTAADVVGAPSDDMLGLPDPADVEIRIDDIAKQLGGAEAANDNLGQSFQNMADQARYSLDGLVNAIKGGDFLSIFTSLADVFLAFGGASLFGGASPTAPKFGGFRADGGPVMSGRSYMVGERGPEMFTATRSGYIHPNHVQRGGRETPVVVQLAVGEGQMFEPRVQSISGDVSIRTTRASNNRAAMAQRQNLNRR